MADQDGIDTHQLLKACRQCPLLAAARLNVLREHMGDGACHVGKTFCALPSHKLAGSSEPTCLASVLRVPYVRVSPLSSVTEEVPSIRGVCTSSLSAVRSVPSCSVTAFSTGSCLSSACVASPAQRERGTEKIETHVNVHGERRTAPPTARWRDEVSSPELDLSEVVWLFLRASSQSTSSSTRSACDRPSNWSRIEDL